MSEIVVGFVVGVLGVGAAVVLATHLLLRHFGRVEAERLSAFQRMSDGIVAERRALLDAIHARTAEEFAANQWTRTQVAQPKAPPRQPTLLDRLLSERPWENLPRYAGRNVTLDTVRQVACVLSEDGSEYFEVPLDEFVNEVRLTSVPTGPPDQLVTPFGVG